MTVGEWLREWFNMHKTQIAETTMVVYKDIYKNHILPHIGDILS